MPTTDQLQFEMQRRVILFNSGTTMPDNTVLGYEGNPNSANTSTPGQTLLYNSPRGTSYIELVNGNLWYKQQIPNTWINLTSGTVSGTANFSSQNNVVFTTGNQDISGVKNFYSRPTVNGSGVLLIGETGSIALPNTLVYITGNQTISGNKTFDVAPIVSGNKLITGLDLSSYATNATLDNKINSLSGYVNSQSTSGQVFNTGSVLDNKINTLSGYVNSQDNIFSGQTFNTGSRLDNKVNSLSGYVNSQDIIFSGQTASTGSRLDDKINALSGYVNSQDIILSGQVASSGSRLDNKINALSGYVSGISAGGTLPSTIVYITGNQTISGTKTFANNLEVQGTGIFNALDLSNISEFNFSGTNINLINGNVNISGGTLYISGNAVLTGVNLNAYATTANLFATGSTLDNKINSLSGYVNAQSTSGQVFNTGSALDNKINALSGYVNNQDIIFSGQTFSTGSRLDNKINSLSGYTNSQDIIFSGQTASTGSLLDNKINSLSGYVDSKSITLPSTIVYTTGDQLISGNKTFLNNIAVSGTGNFNNVKVSNIDKLFLSGIDIVITGNSSIKVYNDIYISGNRVLTGVIPTAQTISNVVYTTGNQLISGNKTFLNNVNISGTGNFNNVKVSSIDNLFLSGIDILITGNSSINVYNAIYISGNPVLTGVIPTAQTITNVVYITGNQAISGTKTFAQTGSFNTLQITNQKLSSYNYNNSNFTFGDIYINIVNSSNNIIGTLPSGITSGINYYVKNLNTGVLLITGSGQRTIDGFSNINLYKNESLQLLGVNNIGYTGWVTLSADNGVS